MQITTIGIDCDDVLSETIDRILKNPKLQSKGITRENILSYDIRKNSELGLSFQEALEFFLELLSSPEFFEIPPVL